MQTNRVQLDKGADCLAAVCAIVACKKGSHVQRTKAIMAASKRAAGRIEKTSSLLRSHLAGHFLLFVHCANLLAIAVSYYCCALCLSRMWTPQFLILLTQLSRTGRATDKNYIHIYLSTRPTEQRHSFLYINIHVYVFLCVDNATIYIRRGRRECVISFSHSLCDQSAAKTKGLTRSLLLRAT